MYSGKMYQLNRRDFPLRFRPACVLRGAVFRLRSPAAINSSPDCFLNAAKNPFEITDQNKKGIKPSLFWCDRRDLNPIWPIRACELWVRIYGESA